jgi:hypothetical protein
MRMDTGLPGTVEESSLRGENCPNLVGVPSLDEQASTQAAERAG